LLFLTLAVAVVVGGGYWLYEHKWPSRVDDREISRIGAPVRGARSIDGSYTSSGDILSQLVRGHGYAAHGELGQLVGEARQHLRAKGYRKLTALRCTQYVLASRAATTFQLECAFSGHRGRFDAGVVFDGESATSFAPSATSQPENLANPSLSVGITSMRVEVWT